MIKKSFQTIFRNRTVLIGFAILIIIPTVLYMAMLFSVTPTWLETLINIDNATEAEILQFIGVYFAFISASMLITLIVMVLGLSPLLHYIGEVCQGIDTKGWYKRGLKKCWWRLLVYNIIATISIIPIMILSMIFVLLIPFAGIILYFLLLIAWTVYMTIGLNIVIVENNFGRALGDIFRVGTKYFFKMLGVTIVGYLPTIALSFIPMIFMPITNYTESFNETSFMTTDILIIYAFTMFFVGVYNVFFIPFLMTYNTYNYLKYRDLVQRPQYNIPNQSQQNHQGSSINTLAEPQQTIPNEASDTDKPQNTNEKESED